VPVTGETGIADPCHIIPEERWDEYCEHLHFIGFWDRSLRNGEALAQDRVRRLQDAALQNRRRRLLWRSRG
jgi:hypothetical protein